MTRIDKQRDPEKKYSGRRIDRIITTISWLVECMGLMIPYKSMLKKQPIVKNDSYLLCE